MPAVTPDLDHLEGELGFILPTGHRKCRNFSRRSTDAESIWDAEETIGDMTNCEDIANEFVGGKAVLPMYNVAIADIVKQRTS